MFPSMAFRTLQQLRQGPGLAAEWVSGTTGPESSMPFAPISKARSSKALKFASIRLFLLSGATG